MSPEGPRAQLVGALDALAEIAGLVAEGREAFDSSEDRRQRLRYLWIVVGSRLKNYARQQDIPRSSGDFAAAIGLRQKLAYQRPDKVRDDIVWRTSVTDAPRLAGHITMTLRALPD